MCHVRILGIYYRISTSALPWTDCAPDPGLPGELCSFEPASVLQKRRFVLFSQAGLSTSSRLFSSGAESACMAPCSFLLFWVSFLFTFLAYRPSF